MVLLPVRDSAGCNASMKSIRSSLVSDVSTPVVLVAVLAKFSLRASILHLKGVGFGCSVH